MQCVNDTPRFRDKSGSLYRRQLIIPFNKSFTGAERKYIKQDYMHRTEVLEYVLHRVLSGSFYELSEPAAVKMALHQYKIENDPVRAFVEEFLDRMGLGSTSVAIPLRALSRVACQRPAV